MKIKFGSFCGLARAAPWQDWLGQTAADLLSELKNALRTGSCKSNSNKMLEIYNKLYARGLGSKFEEFISARFPYMIEGGAQLAPAPVSPQTTSKLNMPNSVTASQDPHGVFANYRPHLLTFPHRLIMCDSDPTALRNKMNNFIAGKASVNTLILGGCGYIEYFEPRYAHIVHKIQVESREIARYKRKHNL